MSTEETAPVERPDLTRFSERAVRDAAFYAQTTREQQEEQ